MGDIGSPTHPHSHVLSIKTWVLKTWEVGSFFLEKEKRGGKKERKEEGEGSRRKKKRKREGRSRQGRKTKRKKQKRKERKGRKEPKRVEIILGACATIKMH